MAWAQFTLLNGDINATNSEAVSAVELTLKGRGQVETGEYITGATHRINILTLVAELLT